MARGSEGAVEFGSLAALSNTARAAPAPDEPARRQAQARNDALTKPHGALGRLEELAIWYSAWRSADKPHVAVTQALVFAGNHGVAARGVSAYPASVTAQMVDNFRSGGAAVNQLVDLVGARLSTVPISLDKPTADFTEAPAMTEAEFLEAVQVGWSSVGAETDCVLLGEMGIGNTTAAAATAAAMFGAPEASAEALAALWTGPGTGIDAEGLGRKRAVVAAGLERHRAEIAATPPAQRPFEALRRLGGREMGALLGACLRARMLRAPVILDGFIVGASVAPLGLLTEDGLAHCLAGHVSAEPGHVALLEHLAMNPLLDLNLRLGEGSGAALAFGLLQAALACHSGMASFDEARVDGPTAP